MDVIKITADEIDVGHILSQTTNASSGGTACFIGTTRDTFEGKKVVHLEYETYYSMAMKELLGVCQAMKKKWLLTNVVFVHRIGTVPVTEVSVLVAASSVHRKEALEAVSYGIDAIKADVPIWKKEQYEDGSYNWKENCLCK